jgi:hypothetical protein
MTLVSVSSLELKGSATAPRSAAIRPGRLRDFVPRDSAFAAFVIQLTPFNAITIIRVIFKQWPLAGEFSEFKYSPNIRRFWRVLEFAKTSDPPNFCDSRRRVWRVLSEFSEFTEIGEFGKFGEGRLDRFIPKNIFFCT